MIWRQLRNHVLQFALACWVLGVLTLGVLLLLLLSSYCTQPPARWG